jgi:hypothetical protein
MAKPWFSNRQLPVGSRTALSHDQTHTTTTIYRLFAGTNFLECNYVKTLENSASDL